MQASPSSTQAAARHFPVFDLIRLLKTVFNPKQGEKACILIDLKDPRDVINFAFLKKSNFTVQKKAYEVFYCGLKEGAMQKLGIADCDFYAYQETGGSNLELPETAVAAEGGVVNFKEDIYPNYDLILCISTFSATAPLTAAAKKFGFRGATLHGVNDIILKTGLSVDYKEVSRETEKLRLGMTHADSVDIDFECEHKPYTLHIDLGRQDAQKSHGLCPGAGDIVNLPAGEVYFVPYDANGQFPLKFEDDQDTLAIVHVANGKVHKVDFLKGDPNIVKAYQKRLQSDPASGILGELGFGTQMIPYSGRDIQDEKIFGTFHLATGRNDHLKGNVTLDKFINKHNATHEDILFSSTKTPEIHLKEVRMQKEGRVIPLIRNYEPCPYLWSLISKS